MRIDTEPHYGTLDIVDCWDLPVLTADGQVYSQCPSCESNGPHPCEEVDGVLVVDCRFCSHEFGWKP